METVISYVMGDLDALTAQKLPFDNLKPLLEVFLTVARPIYFEGVAAEKVTQHEHSNPSKYIIVSTTPGQPIASDSFMLTAKEWDVPYNLIELKARFYSALGARAMHQLRSYGKLECLRCYRHLL